MSSVDSNYAMDKDDCHSVSGALHTMGGMLTNWLCKMQSNVTLSSTETEYQLMAMTLQKIIFTQILLDHPILGVHAGAPVWIHKGYKTVMNTSDWSIGMIFFMELETPNYEKAL
jgi:hypothetical protein